MSQQSANAFDSKEETGPRSVGQICGGIVAKLIRRDPERRRLRAIDQPNDPNQELLFEILDGMPRELQKAILIQIGQRGWVDSMTIEIVLDALGLREV